MEDAQTTDILSFEVAQEALPLKPWRHGNLTPSRSASQAGGIWGGLRKDWPHIHCEWPDRAAPSNAGVICWTSTVIRQSLGESLADVLAIKVT